MDQPSKPHPVGGTRLRRVTIVGLTLLAACSSGAGPTGNAGPDLPESAAEAARFLTQATFGPNAADLERLQRIGFTEWLREQMTMTASLHRPELETRSFGGQSIQQADRQVMWWRHALTAQDQLRQRMAFALSQVFVVSDRAGALINDAIGVAHYYDLMVAHAFGNYRELLEAVALSPQMGAYLSHLRNRKPDPASNVRPDENFAREIMQLFSIGLVMLEQDGTVRRDGNGNPVPSYGQDEIVGLAHVFTGWTYDGSSSFAEGRPNYRPMMNFEEFHDRGSKVVPAGGILPAGRDARAELADLLDRLATHPNVAPFLSKQLIQRFVTANPTPGYVARVVAVWNDNGAGVRGDLGAVLKAILLDVEARTGHRTMPTTFGKPREPLLKQSAVWRAFDARAANRSFDYTNAELDWDQAVLRAETVFNFFRPDHRPQGDLAARGLAAPEFQILTHTAIISQTNKLLGTAARHRATPGTEPQEILLDLTREIELATDPAALVDHLNVRLLGGTMSLEMRAVLIAHLEGEFDAAARASDAVFLIVSSPEFAVQK